MGTNFKNKPPLMLFSGIAAVLNLISSADYILNGLLFNIHNLLSNLFLCAASILILLSSANSSEQKSNTIPFSVLALTATSSLVPFVCQFIFTYIRYTGLYLLVSLVSGVLFVASIILLLLGKPKYYKITVIIGAVINIIVYLFFCIMDLPFYFEYGSVIRLILSIFDYAGTIIFFGVLIVYAMSLSKSENEDQDLLNLNPAKALSLLKERYESGVITEEEYNALRSEILNNL